MYDNWKQYYNIIYFSGSILKCDTYTVVSKLKFSKANKTQNIIISIISHPSFDVYFLIYIII